MQDTQLPFDEENEKKLSPRQLNWLQQNFVSTSNQANFKFHPNHWMLYLFCFSRKNQNKARKRARMASLLLRRLKLALLKRLAWNIVSRNSSRLSQRSRPKWKHSRQKLIQPRELKTLCLSSERLNLCAEIAIEVKSNSSPNGEVQPQSENGSEKLLEKIKINPSKTCALKSPIKAWHLQRRTGGLAKFPSFVPSSPKTLINSVRTTPSGGTTSTT